MARSVGGTAAAYVGAVVGAGFASGREVLHFFARYGTAGVWGAVGAGLLLGILGAMVMELSRRAQVRSYGELLHRIFPTPLPYLMDTVVTFFLLAGLLAVLAGGGSLLAQEAGRESSLGVVAMAICVFAASRSGTAVIFAVNYILILLLLPGTMLATWWIHTQGGPQTIQAASAGWFWSFLLYISYNLTASLGLLAVLGGRMADPRSVWWAGIIAGAILGLLLAMEAYALRLGAHQAAPLPMLLLLARGGAGVRGAFGLVLWLAMVTTGISQGVGLDSRLRMRGWGALPIILPVTAGLAVATGFPAVVERVYPLLGVLGLAIWPFILWRGLKTVPAAAGGRP